MSVRWDTIEGKQKLKEQLQEISYCLLKGVSQKETARLMGISEKTVWAIKKAHPEHFKKVEQITKGDIKNPFDLDNSLIVRMHWFRINEPELYKAIIACEPRIKKHLKLI